MVFNATFNKISVLLWQSVLLVAETTDLSQVTCNIFMVFCDRYSGEAYQVMVTRQVGGQIILYIVSLKNQLVTVLNTTLCDKVCQ
jgi:hypothetical protein